MNRKHIIFYKLLRPLVIIYLKCKFGYRYKKAKNLPDTYIVLSNHTTDYDPLLVGVSFPEQMYFVASEHIVRWGFLFKLIDFIVAPIIRHKGTVATSTVVDVLRKVKKGANVCIFAEGDRTWDGTTRPIAPSTAKLIQSAKCGLVTYKIKGGYFVSPRWSKGLRRGPLSGAPVNVYTKEQLAEMTTEEIYEAITRDLAEDAYEQQSAAPAKYRGKNLAEGMENLLFLCPSCKAHDSFRSEGNSVTCSACGFSFTYNEYGMLEGSSFQTVKELSDRQTELVAGDMAQGINYTAPAAILREIANHQEIPIAEGPLTMSCHSIQCGDTSLSMDSLSDLALHGKRGLVFTADKKYYELIPSEGTNALKFQLFYDAYKMKKKEGTY